MWSWATDRDRYSDSLRPDCIGEHREESEGSRDTQKEECEVFRLPEWGVSDEFKNDHLISFLLLLGFVVLENWIQALIPVRLNGKMKTWEKAECEEKNNEFSF